MRTRGKGRIGTGEGGEGGAGEEGEEGGDAEKGMDGERGAACTVNVKIL